MNEPPRKGLSGVTPVSLGFNEFSSSPPKREVSSVSSSEPPKEAGSPPEKKHEAPEVRPEFNARAQHLKASPPEKRTLDYKPPVQLHAPPAPILGSMSNPTRVEISSHQIEKFKLKQEVKETNYEKKLARIFNYSRER